MNRPLKLFLIIIYIVLLLLPIITILKNGNWGNIFNFYTFMRLAGLYGITLLFIQIILGTFMNYFRKLFGIKIFKFHIMEGIITYLIILLHPTFYFIYNIQTNSFAKALFALLPNTTNSREIYIDLGKLGLVLLTIAVTAGIFRSYPLISKNWRWFHRLNYVVFALVIIHSYFMGTDSRTIPFVLLYPIFVGGLIASVIYKLKNKP